MWQLIQIFREAWRVITGRYTYIILGPEGMILAGSLASAILGI